MRWKGKFALGLAWPFFPAPWLPKAQESVNGHPSTYWRRTPAPRFPPRYKGVLGLHAYPEAMVKPKPPRYPGCASPGALSSREPAAAPGGGMGPTPLLSVGILNGLDQRDNPDRTPIKSGRRAELPLLPGRPVRAATTSLRS